MQGFVTKYKLGRSCLGVHNLPLFKKFCDDALANWHTLNERVKKSVPVEDWTLGLPFAAREFYHCATQDHNGPQANLDYFKKKGFFFFFFVILKSASFL